MVRTVTTAVKLRSRRAQAAKPSTEPRADPPSQSLSKTAVVVIHGIGE